MVAAISGCATTEVSSDRARPVPAARVFAPQLTEPDPAKAHVVIKRDEGLLGSPMTIHLFANADTVADIEPGELINLYLKPGRQILVINDSLQLTGSPAISFICEAGETKVYRISVPGGGGFILQPTRSAN